MESHLVGGYRLRWSALAVITGATLALLAGTQHVAADATPAPTIAFPDPSGSQVTMNFLTSRGSQTATVPVIVTPGTAALYANVLGDLHRTDNMAALPRNQVTVVSSLATDPDPANDLRTLTVTVNSGAVPPGTYTGAILLETDAGQSSTVTLSVTLKDGPAWLIFLIIAVS